MKLALIVDDSKTARVVLRNMLRKHGIDVYAVESGEEALLYLQDNRPDIIFMDHMMPGMDGFEAVKSIKNNPQCSSIPIVMHTTKQGDIYIGQAHALGAADILPKPASNEKLLEVLGSLHRFEQERAEQKSTELEAIGTDTSDELLFDGDSSESTEFRINDQLGVNIDIAPGAKASNKVVGAVEGANGYAVESSAQTAHRANGLNTTVSTAASADIDRVTMSVQSQQQPFFGTLRQWLLVLLWVAPSMWLLWLYLPAQERLEQNENNQRQIYSLLAWALNQQESYDYGEAAMGGRRLELLRELLPRLSAANFHGVIRMTGHIGEFCLTRVTLDDGSQVSILPDSTMPISNCSSIGSTTSQALQLSVRQSEAFTLFSQRVTAISPHIRLEIVPRGTSAPLFPYPTSLEEITAGDWNEVALANNRVYFTIVSSAEYSR